MSDNFQSEIDLLNRKDIIEQLVKTIEFLNSKEFSPSFAVDGTWGCGKTWIIKHLEQKLEEKETICFYYNAWENDYYQEPLVGIIVALKNQINSKKNKLIKFLGSAGETIVCACLSILETAMNTILGTNPIYALGKNVYENFKSKRKKNDSEIDKFVGLKKALKEINGAIEELAVNKKVVIIVDELDRCLPKFAIQTLERLHHLINNCDKITVVYAIDKNQLAKTIENIYGNNTSVEKYLEKFIQFTITIDKGDYTSFSEIPEFKSILMKYNTSDNVGFSVQYNNIMNYFSIRERLEFIHKLSVIDMFLNSREEKKNIGYLFIEICLIVMKKISSNLGGEKYFYKRSIDYSTTKETENAIKWFKNFYIQVQKSKDEYLNTIMPAGIFLFELWEKLIQEDISIKYSQDINEINHYPFSINELLGDCPVFMLKQII